MKSKFLKGFIVYVIVLLVIGVILNVSMHHQLVQLEKNTPENYIHNYLTNQMDDATIQKLFQNNSLYESDTDLCENVRNFFKGGNYELKRKDKNLYDVVVNGNTVMALTLRSLKSVNLLGLLNYDVLELIQIDGTVEKELLSYKITAPSNYQIKVNGVLAQHDTNIKNEEFSDAAKYVEIPSKYVYQLNHFTKEPVIEVVDEPSIKVSFEEGNTIEIDGEKKYDSLEEAGIDFDIIKFAEDWSLFLTNDLTGGTRGFTTISKYFIKDSNMYKKARSWATSIDITFTSKHRLNNPPFPREEVSNVVVYSDNAFKANVILDKSMTILGKQTTQKTDTFNSTIYVVKTKDGYKVTNIKGVTE